MTEKEKKELIINFDPDKVTVDEYILFEPEGFSMSGMKAFIAKYSNLDEEEIGLMTIKELGDLAEEMGKQLAELSTPLAQGGS